MTKASIAPAEDFREAVNRSMASMPPGTSLTDWGRDTPEGRLVSAAKGMNDERLLVWVMAAPMGGAA